MCRLPSPGGCRWANSVSHRKAAAGPAATAGSRMKARAPGTDTQLSPVLAMEDPVLGFASPTNPTAQVLIPPRGMEDPPPRLGIDLGDPDAVDAAHAEAVRRGLRVVYPLTSEPWGVRRFFVEDPSGTVVNVLAHMS